MLGHIKLARHTEATKRYKEREDELQAHLLECDAAIAGIAAEMKTKALGDLSAAEQDQVQQKTEKAKTLQTRCNDTTDALRRNRCSTSLTT